MNWKVLDSKYVLQKPWMTVRQDKVKLPTGAVIPEYYVFEYPAWVNVIAITAEGQFVLVRQYRHGIGRETWEIPAGVVETTDKTPLAGAQRELLEETGFGGGEWRELMRVSGNAAEGRRENERTQPVADKQTVEMGAVRGRERVGRADGPSLRVQEEAQPPTRAVDAADDAVLGPVRDHQEASGGQGHRRMVPELVVERAAQADDDFRLLVAVPGDRFSRLERQL